MRNGELCGLTWDDADVDSARVRVVGAAFVAYPRRRRSARVCPTKAGGSADHHHHHGNGGTVAPAPSVTARAVDAESPDLPGLRPCVRRESGEPLLMNNIGQREYAHLIKCRREADQVPRDAAHVRHAAPASRPVVARRQRAARRLEGINDDGGVRARAARHAAGGSRKVR
jgi:hypothetical protein